MLIWILAASVQCLLLWGIWRGSRNIILQKISGKAPEILQPTPPRVGMIIPAAGQNPAMPKALRSLLEQDYPHILPIVVTATEDDPAYNLALTLQEEYPHLHCLAAGVTSTCGQKNHNTLQAINYIKSHAEDVEIYIFCDSTHLAKPNFVRELVWPIINNDAGFTTGYHNVVAKDTRAITLAYLLCVLNMRFMQAVALFTQPWGGAMAISRKVFEENDIASFWADNVVDDCSLASILSEKRLPVRLCPHAILETEARDTEFSVFCAWLERQILFLKFCIMPQWVLLGVFACLVILPVIISCLFVVGGIVNILPASMSFYSLFALIHLGILSLIVLGWRELVSPAPPFWAWLKAFFLGSGAFFVIFMRTLTTWKIDWHGIRYTVGKGGKVRHIEKL